MANFLNTSKINFLIEELIQTAKVELILISPYLKFNDRMRELLQDKARQSLEIKIVYGKDVLKTNEKTWLSEQPHIKNSFCKNLHSKCYLNEYCCIVTSMNLYDFSQVNNNEMGISLHKNHDKLLYNEVYEEAQRLLRISEQVGTIQNQKNKLDNEYSKLTTANLAVHYGKKTNEIFELLRKQR
jgi:phosphatidylserine/phosphatidylglycerophosphate/cardiolipin synthase-like enzyme